MYKTGQTLELRAKWITLEKDCKVIFPKKLLHANEILNESFCNLL
jgi:hypothetical protein